MSEHYDFVIIGGGIVGASTAMQLIARHPDRRIVLLEKETASAQHQTGRNSGVIHAGVYYAPGSLKADFCRRGLEATIDFCQQYDIEYDKCGKLIVATDESELEGLNKLYTNSAENGLEVSWVEQDKLKEIEPNIRGIKAFLVKDSAITNYKKITHHMLENFKKAGGKIVYQSEVSQITETDDSVIVSTNNDSYKASFLVACAGLQADRIVKMIGVEPNFQIVPFKGEYYKLSYKLGKITQHLIYPVPDPEMPFLGVHLTNMIDGSITVGPNAVLSFKREGYSKLAFDLKDLTAMFMFPGFWKVIFANLRSGIGEMKNSLHKAGYLKLVQRYCPTIQLEDLKYYPPGIRAQAVTKKGELVHDFLFEETNRSLHVCNAPSPAATSAIPIGEYICDSVAKKTIN